MNRLLFEVSINDLNKQGVQLKTSLKGNKSDLAHLLCIIFAENVEILSSFSTAKKMYDFGLHSPEFASSGLKPGDTFKFEKNDFNPEEEEQENQEYFCNLNTRNLTKLIILSFNCETSITEIIFNALEAHENAINEALKTVEGMERNEQTIEALIADYQNANK